VADNLTAAQRSYCMSRVRNRDTNIETEVRSLVHRKGLRFRKHVRAIPGSPDLVFIGPRVAVFIDGDFWHGYRFPAWSKNISPFWQSKIAGNRSRDQRNFRRLRRAGWQVIRVWQHEIKDDPSRAAERIALAVRSARR